MYKNENRMYSNPPNLVIGFHGCDKTIADKIITGKINMRTSTNNYDWLGNGMYFWEQNLQRARLWAEEGCKNPKINIQKPAVVGAVIDLGYCLNLMDSRSSMLLREHYNIVKYEYLAANREFPKNRNVSNDSDLLLRELDCTVIQSLHAFRKEHNLPAFDTVRGLFLEGDELYPSSGFKEKTHIQIAVRNPNCIKGFFYPREINESWNVP